MRTPFNVLDEFVSRDNIRDCAVAIIFDAPKLGKLDDQRSSTTPYYEQVIDHTQCNRQCSWHLKYTGMHDAQLMSLRQTLIFMRTNSHAMCAEH